MRTADKKVESKKHRVLVIGGNFAGLSALKNLSSMNMGDLDIFLIDPSEYFNWTPNIHEILSGAKTKESVEISREALVASLGVTFIKDYVNQLNTVEKSVYLSNGNKIKFDACLIACGYQSALSTETDSSFNFRNGSDITQITEAIDKVDEPDRNVEISILGGGFTGVEALGELLRKYGKSRHLKVTVFEASDQLVKGLPAAISDDILELTSTLPVEFKFNASVTDVKDGHITLADGSVRKSDITIWTGGGELPSFVSAADLVEPAGTGISVEATLQCKYTPSCFAAGDAASIFIGQEKRLPKQSYHAIDTGKFAASNMIKWLRSSKLDEFVPRPKPTLLSFGNINTYMATGDSVIASPLLAATKEAIYQVNMYKLFLSLPFAVRKKSLVNRLTMSTNTLLLPELMPNTILKILTRSRILNYGGISDLKPFILGIQSFILD